MSEKTRKTRPDVDAKRRRGIIKDPLTGIDAVYLPLPPPRYVEYYQGRDDEGIIEVELAFPPLVADE
jgi:hypothetical protein